MPAFQYQAIDQSGKTCTGILEGDCTKSIRQQLRARNLIPVEVDILNKSRPGKRDRIKLKKNSVCLITRQLATLIGAQLPIEKALLGVSEQTDGAKEKQVLLHVRTKVLEGHSLSQALGQFPQTFPELYCATVAAGEQTGRLDMVLNRLADFAEQQQKMNQKVQQALIYPAMMVFVSISIITFLLIFVVPKIISVFDSTGQALPDITQYLINISYFIKHYGLFMLAVMLILLILFKQSLKQKKILLSWHRFLLRVPLISYLIKTVNTARYAHTLSILSNAGVPILKSMTVSTNLVTNLVIRDAIEDARITVKEGSNIGLALKNSGVFSPMAIHLISSGETSGKLADMLNHAAQTQDDEVKRVIETGLTLFEPLIILLMGAVILFIVLATLLPIFSMDQLVH
jgi:general secretion pathway protein F